MKSAEVRIVIDEKYGDYQNDVIDRFRCQKSGPGRKSKKVPPAVNGAGEHGETDAWELLKTQLKQEGGIFFDASTERLRSLCVRLVKSLPLSEIKLLWLRTDAYLDYDGLDFPDRESMEESVWEELNQAIFRRAVAPDDAPAEPAAEPQVTREVAPAVDDTEDAPAAPAKVVSKKPRRSKSLEEAKAEAIAQPTLDL